MIPGSCYGWRPNERNISRTSHICSRAISIIASTTHASPVSCPTASRRTMCRDCSLTRNSALAIRISSEGPTRIPSAAPLRRCVASRSNWITVRRLRSTAQTAGTCGLPVSVEAGSRSPGNPASPVWGTPDAVGTPTHDAEQCSQIAARSLSIESTEPFHLRSAMRRLASKMGGCRTDDADFRSGRCASCLRSGVFDQVSSMTRTAMATCVERCRTEGPCVNDGLCR